MTWCLVKHRENFIFAFILGGVKRRMKWSGHMALMGE
jgi:hypothetical protein